MDDELVVEDLKSMVRQFVSERNWEKFHTPKDLAVSICLEASELLELFQWRSSAESVEWVLDKSNRRRVEEELSDIMIYLLSFVNILDLDLSDAVIRKLEEDRRKYPEDQYKGRAYLS